MRDSEKTELNLPHVDIVHRVTDVAVLKPNRAGDSGIGCYCHWRCLYNCVIQRRHRRNTAIRIHFAQCV